MNISGMPSWLKPEQLQYLISILKKPSMIDVVVILLTTIFLAAFALQGKVWDRPDPYGFIYFERPQATDGVLKIDQGKTRNIAHQLDSLKKDVVVFWASQSGTSEGFAYRLSRSLKLRFGLEVLIADLSDYDSSTIAEIPTNKLTIFILSTYGEGGPSDNATMFWNWVCSEEKKLLPQLRFLSFGLGNSNYKYYNNVVKVVHDTFVMAGATALLPIAMADDAHGSTEEDFLSWESDIFQVLRTSLQLEEQEVSYLPTLSVIEDKSLQHIALDQGEPVHTSENGRVGTPTSSIKPLSVKSTHNLFRAGNRDCIHMELDLTDHAALHYKTGDHLAVWPINPSEEVERLLSVLGRTTRRNTPLVIESLNASIKRKVPSPTCLETLLRYHLEICAPLSRSVLLDLTRFAPSNEARSFLTTLGNDRDAFADYRARNIVTFGRILEAASPSEPWSNIPLSYVVETLPNLQPRYYSISSSSVLSPRRLSITFLVTTSALPDNKEEIIYGLTTNYLLAISHSISTPFKAVAPLTYQLSRPSQISEEMKVHAHIRRTKFKTPTATTPMILIANGTGIAPFRAFITERAKLQKVGKPVGKMLLFFGCRNPEEDYIYQEELKDAQDVLTEEKFKIITAFSRTESTKVYVQDRIQTHCKDVIDLLDESASLFICGRASMSREVGKRIAEAYRTIKGVDDETAHDWSESLKKKGKWKEDVWD